MKGIQMTGRWVQPGKDESEVQCKQAVLEVTAGHLHRPTGARLKAEDRPVPERETSEPTE